MKYVGIVTIVILSVGVALAFLNNYLPRWFCDHFPHWHVAPKEIGFDGCSQTGKCGRCGTPVLQDSQGNWF